jgi:hypothetical protein
VAFFGGIIFDNVKSVILRCEPCGALAPLGEPRRMSGLGLSPFETAALRPPLGDGDSVNAWMQ